MEPVTQSLGLQPAMEPYPCQDNPPDKHRDAQLNSLCEAMGKAEGILGAQGGFPAQGSDEGTQPHKKPCAPWAHRAGRAGGRVPSLLSEAQQAHESQQGGWIGAPQGTTGAKHLDHPQGCSGTPLPPRFHQFWFSSKPPQCRSHPTPSQPSSSLNSQPSLPQAAFVPGTGVSLSPKRHGGRANPGSLGGDGLCGAEFLAGAQSQTKPSFPSFLNPLLSPPSSISHPSGAAFCGQANPAVLEALMPLIQPQSPHRCFCDPLGLGRAPGRGIVFTCRGCLCWRTNTTFLLPR